MENNNFNLNGQGGRAHQVSHIQIGETGDSENNAEKSVFISALPDSAPKCFLKKGILMKIHYSPISNFLKLSPK